MALGQFAKLFPFPTPGKGPLASLPASVTSGACRRSARPPRHPGRRQGRQPNAAGKGLVRREARRPPALDGTPGCRPHTLGKRTDVPRTPSSRTSGRPGPGTRRRRDLPRLVPGSPESDPRTTTPPAAPAAASAWPRPGSGSRSPCPPRGPCNTPRSARNHNPDRHPPVAPRAAGWHWPCASLGAGAGAATASQAWPAPGGR
jgi:hypothetical protein